MMKRYITILAALCSATLSHSSSVPHQPNNPNYNSISKVGPVTKLELPKLMSLKSLKKGWKKAMNEEDLKIKVEGLQDLLEAAKESASAEETDANKRQKFEDFIKKIEQRIKELQKLDAEVLHDKQDDDTNSENSSSSPTPETAVPSSASSEVAMSTVEQTNHQETLAPQTQKLDQATAPLDNATTQLNQPSQNSTEDNDRLAKMAPVTPTDEEFYATLKKEHAEQQEKPDIKTLRSRLELGGLAALSCEDLEEMFFDKDLKNDYIGKLTNGENGELSYLNALHFALKTAPGKDYLRIRLSRAIQIRIRRLSANMKQASLTEVNATLNTQAAAARTPTPDGSPRETGIQAPRSTPASGVPEPQHQTTLDLSSKIKPTITEEQEVETAAQKQPTNLIEDKKSSWFTRTTSSVARFVKNHKPLLGVVVLVTAAVVGYRYGNSITKYFKKLALARAGR